MDYEPVLTIWATADYAEDQLLDSDITTIPTLWSRNLLTITGAQVRLAVSRDKTTGAVSIKLQSAPSAFQVSATSAVSLKLRASHPSYISFFHRPSTRLTSRSLLPASFRTA